MYGRCSAWRRKQYNIGLSSIVYYYYYFATVTTLPKNLFDARRRTIYLIITQNDYNNNSGTIRIEGVVEGLLQTCNDRSARKGRRLQGLTHILFQPLQITRNQLVCVLVHDKSLRHYSITIHINRIHTGSARRGKKTETSRIVRGTT